MHARSHRSSWIKRPDTAIFTTGHETVRVDEYPANDVNSRINLNWAESIISIQSENNYIFKLLFSADSAFFALYIVSVFLVL